MNEHVYLGRIHLSEILRAFIQLLLLLPRDRPALALE